jgi:hypothetical protein
MAKKTAAELAEGIVEVTLEYTREYFKIDKNEKLDRNLWQALHIGFCGALAIEGYDKKTIMRSLEIAQKGLTPFL